MQAAYLIDPIARDGASFLEVQTHIQVALSRLATHRAPAVAEGARITSGRALSYAAAALPLEADIAKVRALAIAPPASLNVEAA